MFLKKCFFFNGQCQMFAHTLRDYLLRSEKECSFDVFFQVFSLDFLFPSFFHLSIATLIQCFPLLMFEFQCCDFEIVVRGTCVIMSDNNLAKHPPAQVRNWREFERQKTGIFSVQNKCVARPPCSRLALISPM